MKIALAILVLALLAPAAGARQQPAGVLLEELTWVEAEKVLTRDAVVVIPLGAAAKEHGPHLPLNADRLQALYCAGKVRRRAPVVVAPAIDYGYYPAFAEYPGSTTLRLEVARDLVVDACRSLARYGPRRFYVINIGISTARSLEAAAEVLAAEGILLRYTDLGRALEPAAKKLCRQEGGSHADEVETSLMLYMYPGEVDMKKAVKDYSPRGGALTRDRRNERGTYSPSGVWGDATLATREKGRLLAAALVDAILADVEALRRSAPPAG